MGARVFKHMDRNWPGIGWWRELVKRVVSHAVLIVGGFVMLLPFLWMVSTSLKTPAQAYVFPPRWIPNPIDWSTYPRALGRLPFHMYFRNTAIITAVNIGGVLVTSTLTGYAFARLRFPARERLFGLCLATMMLPGVVTLIPRFILFRNLGWINTFAPLTVPAWFGGGAFNIFLARQFFRTIPLELDEAARIDGAGSWRIWLTIILPLSQPLLATLGVFSFVFHWNDFLGPLIYLYDQELFTISLGLKMYQELMHIELVWSDAMAASVVTTLPVVVLFFFAQRYFMRGMVMSGLAGR
jgi:multiple sugar transport system permease protein